MYAGRVSGVEDKARELFARLDQNKTREDFVAAAKHLKHEPHGNGRLGVVGLCYGGGIANMLATRLPDLDAAVPFYGMAPATTPRYDEAAAKLAWQRTIALFNRTLRHGSPVPHAKHANPERVTRAVGKRALKLAKAPYARVRP